MKKGSYTPWIVLIYNTIQCFHQRKVFPKFGENQSKIAVANRHILQYMNLHVIYSLLQNRSPVVLLRCDRLSQVHKLWLPETSTESSSTVRILWPNGSIDSIIIQKLPIQNSQLHYHKCTVNQHIYIKWYFISFVGLSQITTSVAPILKFDEN